MESNVLLSRKNRLLSVFVCCVVMFNVSSASASVRLTRHPYIQNPTTSSVTICWHTDIPASCVLEYGLTSGWTARTKPDEPTQRHVVQLTDLQANATYSYRIFVEEEPLTDTLTFQTNKDDFHSAFSFVVFGDSGTGGEYQMAVARQMQEVEPDFGLITGDIVYPSGASKDYNNNYFIPYRDIISSVCFYPSLGNHDYRTNRGKPYLENFILPANNPARSEKYYSFDYGNAHFICLDSNLRRGVKEEKLQFEWLKEDLASARSLWKFVFLHHPPYSSGSHGSEMRLRKRFCGLFEQYSVDMVFCGHDHSYERTVRIKEFFPDGEGVIYVVTGGGGARLYRVARSEWTVFAKSAFHFVHIEIEGRTLRLRAIDSDGEEFDNLRVNKLPH